MHYFFDNARNDRGLCATEGCTGRPVHTLVYRYCEKCAVLIAHDLEARHAVSLATAPPATRTPAIVRDAS